jgi:Zn-dependent protease with chaperone function
MRRLVLKAVLHVGRYAVLPVVILAGAMLVAWLTALDHHRTLALVTAPIVLSSSPAAIALAVGLLILPRRRDAKGAVDASIAPGLWALWKEHDRAFARCGRTLVIDSAFNASIREEKHYFGLFGRHLTMTVGLPLLIVLDERAIRAVIAHEVAHARLQHTSGGVNLADFITAAENVLHYADPDRTITGRIAYVLLHSMLEWLEQEYRTLSRQNELAADGDAAQHVGRDEMARALVLIGGAGARLVDLVFAPLDKELLGAIRAPTPPFQRILKEVGTIRAPNELAAAARAHLQGEPEAESTHPPLGARLANLGFAEMPPLDQLQTSAIAQLLAPEAAKELTARFDNEWRRKADELVDIGGCENRLSKHTFT